mmetsp:Transcript_20415/g.78277  ORF Transcript_20415/g.78277 Transcript_20415/m.78277 type:complete len:246 (-) Transcript_20415:487-1224(-)
MRLPLRSRSLRVFFTISMACMTEKTFTPQSWIRSVCRGTALIFSRVLVSRRLTESSHELPETSSSSRVVQCALFVLILSMIAERPLDFNSQVPNFRLFTPVAWALRPSESAEADLFAILFFEKSMSDSFAPLFDFSAAPNSAQPLSPSSVPTKWMVWMVLFVAIVSARSVMRSFFGTPSRRIDSTNVLCRSAMKRGFRSSSLEPFSRIPGHSLSWRCGASPSQNFFRNCCSSMLGAVLRNEHLAS